MRGCICYTVSWLILSFRVGQAEDEVSAGEPEGSDEAGGKKGRDRDRDDHQRRGRGRSRSGSRGRGGDRGRCGRSTLSKFSRLAVYLSISFSKM